MEKFNIQIEPTANGNIIKFVVNSFLTQAQSFEFKNIDEASQSPLAQQLFYLPFVKTVYISQNFIAIEKYNIVEWSEVQGEVSDAISEYLNSGKAVISEGKTEKKIPVSIYAESTPNPAVMKFVANKPLVNGTFEFKNKKESENAPLVQKLFGFPFVKEVFMTTNYISIMKYDMADWHDITMELREFIRIYIENGNPILEDGILNTIIDSERVEKSESQVTSSIKKSYTELEQEIVDILDEYVKPAVAGDGGHIAFESFDPETKTVKVILQGACSGCPSSTATLKNGIQAMLADMLEGRVETVEAING